MKNLVLFMVTWFPIVSAAASSEDKVAQPTSLPSDMMREPTDFAIYCVDALKWLKEAKLNPNTDEGERYFGDRPVNKMFADQNTVVMFDPAKKDHMLIYSKEGVLRTDGRTCNRLDKNKTVDDLISDKIRSEMKKAEADVVNCEENERKKLPVRPDESPSMISCFENRFKGCKNLGPKTAAAIQTVLNKAKPSGR